MLIPVTFWVLAVISAVLCGIGFYRFIWFLSVGYGLAIAGCGLGLGVMALLRGECGIAFAIQCILMVVYGCRLGLFLLIREIKNATYRKTLDSQTSKPVPLFVKIVMWICLFILYPCQVSAVMYRLDNGLGTSSDPVLWIGILIMLIGILLEATADKQKSAQKKVRPNMAAMDGLFRLCRCPNYLGEVLFWTGIVISGIGAVTGLQWIIVLFGYVCIVGIMVSGANRLDKRQQKNYGDNEEFRQYCAKTKKLIPYIW